MKLQSVDVTIFVGDGRDQRPGHGHRLETVGYLLHAVAVSQQDLLLLSQAPVTRKMVIS